MSCDEESFRANAASYNKALKKLCRKTPGVHYERLQGFTGIDVATEKPLDMWSDDKIHLRTAVAAPGTDGEAVPTPMDRYQKRLFYVIKHYLSDQ